MQRGIRENSSLAKFVLGAHPIIERAPLRETCRKVSTFLVVPARWLPASNVDLAVASSDECFITVEDAQQARSLLLQAPQLLPSFLEVFLVEGTCPTPMLATYLV